MNNGLSAALRMTFAEAMCADQHPGQAARIERRPEATDPRNRIAACYGCIRAADTVLATPDMAVVLRVMEGEVEIQAATEEGKR